MFGTPELLLKTASPNSSAPFVTIGRQRRWGLLHRTPVTGGNPGNTPPSLTVITSRQPGPKPNPRTKVMPGQTPQTGSPEPLGLQVAGEVQKAVAPATVILYGSRAAGDHRSDSDVDLMIIAPDRSAAGSATADANHWLRTAGPDLDVNITT